MTKRISALLAAAALTVTLSACGSEKETPGSGGSDNGSTTIPGGITDGSDADHREDDARLPGDAAPAVPGTLPDASSDVTPGSEQTGVSLDQMLRNARVRDRDGDLLDGENAVTPGADGW